MADKKFVVIADISYTGRLEVFAEDAKEARSIALDTYPDEWDIPYGELIQITATEQLDD